jgi:hypothetical protein
MPARGRSFPDIQEGLPFAALPIVRNCHHDRGGRPTIGTANRGQGALEVTRTSSRRCVSRSGRSETIETITASFRSDCKVAGWSRGGDPLIDGSATRRDRVAERTRRTSLELDVTPASTIVDLAWRSPVVIAERDSSAMLFVRLGTATASAVPFWIHAGTRVSFCDLDGDLEALPMGAYVARSVPHLTETSTL